MAINESVATQDIARLAGVSRGRIAQIHGAGEMPAPDANNSTAQRPRWRRPTAVRWLVSIGKRPDWEEASWLIPGPDGPQLEQLGSSVIDLEGQPETSRFDAPTILQVHVQRYYDRQMKRSLWLVTPLLPNERWKLVNSCAWTLPSAATGGNRSRQALIDQLAAILTDFDSYRTQDDGYLGLLVVLPVAAATSSTVWDLEPPTAVDVTRVRQAVTTSEPRLLTDHSELGDLVKALGHRLPMWPPGCATPELVAVADPTGPPVQCEIPPVMEAAWRYHQVCQSITVRAPEEVGALLAELGRAYWDSKVPYYGRDGFTPTEYDEEMWAPALDVQLPRIKLTPSMDWWPAVEWMLASDDAPAWLGEETARYFGDPDSVGVAVLDLTSLPAAAAEALSAAGRPAGDGQRSQRARRLVTALDQYGPVELDRWSAPAGVDWRARAGDHVAVHVPRLVPAPTEIGEPLDVTITKDEAGAAVGVITTDTGRLSFLPSLRNADSLAMAVEHLVWHPGLPVPLAGLYAVSLSAKLQKAIGAMLGAGGRTVPWRQLMSQVGEHSEPCFVTGCKLRKS